MEKVRCEQLIMAGKLSPEEKSEVSAAATALGIRMRGVCQKCCELALEQIFAALSETESVSRDGYRMRRRLHPFRVGGVLVSQATLPRLTVGSFRHSVVDKFFVKAEAETETETETKTEENGDDGDIRG